jgi:hypothetical protein
MNELFPFGFAPATALYLGCYVATLCMHLVLMSYTLAGAAYLAVLGIVGKERWSAARDVGAIIQDWLPFSLGLAITAGVAPLLFLQVLYEPLFYSANLLLFHRWMLIVPILIFGFYLLYLLKSDFGAQRQGLWRASAIVAFLCFAFVGWAWTENHLLSRASDQWVTFYASKQVFFRSSETIPRLLFWFLAAAAILSVLLGWQLRFTRASSTPAHQRLVCMLGLVAAPLAALCLTYYATQAAPALPQAIAAPAATPYALAALLGFVLMLAGWVTQLRQPTSHWPSLLTTTAGMSLVVLGVSVVREVQRLQQIDVSAFTEAHARAAASGGLLAFVVLLVVNSCLIAFALRVASEAIARSS